MIVCCFFFCRCSSLFCILKWISGLSVEKVLFISSIDGFIVSVCVRFMCCCILLDSLFGSSFLYDLRLMCFSVVCVIL